MIEGIDVSRHQGAIDWPHVADQGIEFAWIKASEGRSWVDPRFTTNRRQATDHGIRVGAYHYARPQNSPNAEAEHFARAIGDTAGELAPVLDVEEHGGRGPDGLAGWILAVLLRLEELLARTPAVYCSPGWWDACVSSSAIGNLDRFPLWVAHWHTDTPRLPQAWTRWAAHQYTSSGHVPGIVGRVDRNRAPTFAPLIVPKNLQEALMLVTGYVDHAATPDGNGYWILDREGGVFTFGDARYFGSIPALRKEGHDIGDVDAKTLTPTPSGKGYWILDDAGGVFTFGDARYHGSIPALRKQQRERT